MTMWQRNELKPVRCYSAMMGGSAGTAPYAPSLRNARMGGKLAARRGFRSPGCDASFAPTGRSAAQGIGVIRQSAHENRRLRDGIV